MHIDHIQTNLTITSVLIDRSRARPFALLYYLITSQIGSFLLRYPGATAVKSIAN